MFFCGRTDCHSLSALFSTHNLLSTHVNLNSKSHKLFPLFPINIEFGPVRVIFVDDDVIRIFIRQLLSESTHLQLLVTYTL